MSWTLVEKYLITVDKNFEKPRNRGNEKEDLKTGDAPDNFDCLVGARGIREAFWPLQLVCPVEKIIVMTRKQRYTITEQAQMNATFARPHCRQFIRQTCYWQECRLYYIMRLA